MDVKDECFTQKWTTSWLKSFNPSIKCPLKIHLTNILLHHLSILKFYRRNSHQLRSPTMRKILIKLYVLVRPKECSCPRNFSLSYKKSLTTKELLKRNSIFISAAAFFMEVIKTESNFPDKRRWKLYNWTFWGSFDQLSRQLMANEKGLHR